MRSTEIRPFPTDIQRAIPEVLPCSSETTLLCVRVNGYMLKETRDSLIGSDYCIRCFDNLPNWKYQTYRGDHYLQISRINAEYNCARCGINPVQIRDAYSCRSCRQTLIRINNHLRSIDLSFDDLPERARIASQLRSR